MGTLLIPQRQLSRQLGVLIDTRFDLQRAVYQLVFREVVDYRRTILCTVTASSNPANQVVPVGRRERQNLNELGVGFARQFHKIGRASGRERVTSWGVTV